ncbi:MAG: hypothetical protein RH946_18365 [Rhodospirillales bacterium]
MMHSAHSGRLITALLTALFILTGCAQPRDAVPLGGTLSVLGPDQVLIEAVSRGTLPPGWEISGEMPADAISIRRIESYNALALKAGTAPYAVLRHTQASLLATPYLSWAWHTPSVPNGAHPVRIIVGLVAHGVKTNRPWWQVGGGGDETIRVIQVVWQATALGRGTVVGPRRQEGRPESARYNARGGPEQANRWWFDTVDLSLIHRQVWPGDDLSRVDIRYIGIAVQAAPPPKNGSTSEAPSMNVTAMRLMR